MGQRFAAVFIRAVVVNQRHQIYGSRGHRVTMKKPRFKKHPAKMTTAELAESVFHPKVLRAAKKELAAHESKSKPGKAR